MVERKLGSVGVFFTNKGTKETAFVIVFMDAAFPRQPWGLMRLVEN